MPMNYNFTEIINTVGPETMEELSDNFQDMMMRYECAVMEVETKIKVLNEEFSLRMQRNPIESIKSRIKSPASICEKMKRRGYEMTTENMEKYFRRHLNDIKAQFGGAFRTEPEEVFAFETLHWDHPERYEMPMEFYEKRAARKAEQFPRELRNAFDAGVRFAERMTAL